MSYDYKNEKPEIFTEDGQVMFLKIRDEANRLVGLSGCVMMGKLLVGTGDSWTMLACVDRMVELGELVEIKYGNCAAQHRIFSKRQTG
jgi:hypothetical protein